MANQFLKNIVLKGKIETVTGLHIGGSKEKLEIGGVDSPVIRDPNTRYPYIPGSSLKGKMRHLIEFALGKVTSGKVYESNDPDDPICRIFGTSAQNSATGPTRLTFRDVFPDKDTVEMWENLDSELQYTELKPENSIDRLTSEANPRFLERVVPGSSFNFEIVYSVYDMNDGGKKDEENFELLLEGLRLLEHSGLGGSVSRGYGQIKFTFAEPIVVERDDYKNGTEKYKNSAKTVEELGCKLTLADLHLTESK